MYLNNNISNEKVSKCKCCQYDTDLLQKPDRFKVIYATGFLIIL